MSRPGYSVWVVAAVFGVMAFAGAMAIGLNAGDSNASLWTGALTVVCTVIATVALSQGLWSVVAADADGLYWRALFQRSRTAPWNAVTECYLRQSGPLNTEAVVETRAGTIVLGADWRGLDAIKEAVSRNATSVGPRAWSLLGTRPGDAPRTFTYDTAANRRDAVILPFVGLLLGGGVLFRLGWTVAGIAELRRVAAPVVMAAVLLCFIVAMVAVVAMSLLALMSETSRRRKRRERITTSPDGIRFESDERSLSARWDEIIACDRGLLPGVSLDAPRFLIRTRHGDFDFVTTIENHFHLKKLIAAMVPAEVAAWRDASGEVVRVNPARWPASGEDSHLFHYRTRSNRALLAFVGVACAVSVAMAAARGGGYVFVALMSLSFAWFVWRYLGAAIRVDSRGITHFGALGNSFLPWNAIRQVSVRKDGRDGLNRESVRGDGQSIVFWDVISDVEILRAEIRRRMPET